MRLSDYNPTRCGWVLLGAVAVLCATGLAGIHAAEHELSETVVGLTAMHRQMIYVAAGVAAMLAVIRVGYRPLGRWAYAIYALVLGLLALLVVARLIGRWGMTLPMIPRSRETYRWIQLPGFQIQPSEFMKIAYVLGLAWYLRFRENYRTLRGLVGPFVLTIVPMLLILLEPDLGTVVLLMPILLLMLLLAGAKMRHLVGVLVACLIAAPIMFQTVMHGYQKMRVLGPVFQNEQAREWVLDHEQVMDVLKISPKAVVRWEVEKGYQLDQSKIAIGCGGVVGRASDEHVGYLQPLPDRHNDLIFSVVANQGGLIGALVVLTCFGVIAVTGLAVAGATDDPFARLLAVGLTATLTVQGLLNLGVAVGLAPMTGMTLPLVSFGGSSMLTSFVAVGLLISVARHRPMLLAPKPFEFDEAPVRPALIDVEGQGDLNGHAQGGK